MSIFIFVDSQIPQIETLLRHLPRDAAVSRIGAREDALAAIAARLSGEAGIEKLMLVAHGAPGILHLGAVPLTAEGLEARADALAAIGAAMAPDGLISLYGCQVAAGAGGDGFLDRLEALTGRAVAATDRLVGHADLDGGWTLLRHGAGQPVPMPFAADLATDYRAVLADVTLNSSNETPVLTDGDDTIRASFADSLNPGDVIDGEGGSDTLIISVAHNVTFNATTLTNVETVQITHNSGNVRIVTNDATVAAGQTMTVDGSTATGTITWDGRAELDGTFNATGGEGNDTLYGGAGNDTLYGGDGNDLIYGGEGNDTLYGGAGNDTLYGGDGDNVFYSGDGNDFVYALGGNDLVYGGDGNDGLSGGAGNDTLWGEAGNDTLIGGAGNDLLYGGDGNDLIWGQDDNDTIYGGAGNDTLSGDAGDDLLFGEDGNDTLSGGNGDDTLYGGEGNDLLYGGSDADTLYGGEGNDTLWGDVGNDLLYGGEGNDLLYGGSGNDLLYGGAGDDTLDGGDSPDTLWGGDGNDVFRGSLADLNGDTIGDFSIGDSIVVVGADVSALDGKAASGTLDLEGGIFSVTLTGITAASGTFKVVVSGGDSTITLEAAAPPAAETPTNPVIVTPVTPAVPGTGGGQAQNIANNGTAPAAVAIVKDSNNNGNVVTVTLPGSTGLTSEGPAQAQNLSEAQDSLIASLQVRGSAAQEDLAAGVRNFLNSLAPDTVLDVRTIVPTIPQGASLSTPIIITGTADSGQTDAFVINMRQMPAGSSLQLDNIEFATILGAASITGGAGNNHVVGDEASQYIMLGEGDDYIDGGAGNDTVGSAGGNDTLLGGAGDDLVFGGAGDDSLDGGDGFDILDLTGGGSNFAQGGRHGDTILGGDGGDEMRGGKGHDSIVGGAGDDVIYSGQGNDTLTGGDGADLFVLKGYDPEFSNAILTPTITDFQQGTDRFAVENATLAELQAAIANQTVTEAGVVLHVAGATLTFLGIAQLTAADIDAAFYG